jgi:uncharacterized protein
MKEMDSTEGAPSTSGLEQEMLAPVATSERMRGLDILRGFALLGVLLMNLHSSFRILIYDFAMRFHAHDGFLNKAVDYLLEVAVMGKAMLLLSLLFGAGMAMQVDRARAVHRNPTRFLARRLAILFAFGVLHYFLLWDGDILMIYSLCGFILLAFQNLSAGTLARMAILACLVEFLMIPSGENYDWNYLGEYVRAEYQWFLYGSYVELVYYRFFLLATRVYSEWRAIFPASMGMMLLGMAAWKAGVFLKVDVFRARLRKVVAVGGAFGLCATVISVRNRESLDFDPVDAVLGITGTVALALAYGAAGWLYLSRSNPSPLLERVGDFGRMTLTNYLLQSLIFTTLFYGYGCGLLGRVSSSMALLLGLAVFTIQIYFSEYWLRRHSFGPAEWLWRRLTYGSKGMLKPVES